MLVRFCEAQGLRALMSTRTLPRVLHPLIDHFRYRFDYQQIRGTLFTDMFGFKPSAPPTTSAKSIPLSNDIKQALGTWFDSQDLPGCVPKYGTEMTSVAHHGAFYKPSSVSRADSFVVVRRAHSKTWKPAQINAIFKIEYYESGNKQERTFLAVKYFKHLLPTDARHDHYRRFPLVAGRIYYEETSPDSELISFHDILSHFAMTPDVCPEIEKPHMHVLPLDRVSHHRSLSMECY